MKVGFIGTGNMGGALAHAAAQSPAPAELLLSNRTPEKAQALAQQLGATVSDNETIAQTCDYIFLGVKPQMMADLLARLRPILSRRQEGFVLGSAAGLTLQRLREMAGLSCPILRIMPNTACAVGAGLTLYVPSPEVTEEQLSAFLTLMSASGRLEPLEEHLIDAGSAVAGCGGAFVMDTAAPLSSACFGRRWPTAPSPAACPVTRPGATPPRWCWVRRSWLSSPTSTPPL